MFVLFSHPIALLSTHSLTPSQIFSENVKYVKFVVELVVEHQKHSHTPIERKEIYKMPASKNR